LKITREETPDFEKYTVMMGAPNPQPAPMDQIMAADSDAGVVVFYSLDEKGEIDKAAPGIQYECPVTIAAPGVKRVQNRAAPVSANPRLTGGCCGG
jgi:hypothetical protein